MSTSDIIFWASLIVLLSVIAYLGIKETPAFQAWVTRWQEARDKERKKPLSDPYQPKNRVENGNSHV